MAGSSCSLCRSVLLQLVYCATVCLDRDIRRKATGPALSKVHQDRSIQVGRPVMYEVLPAQPSSAVTLDQQRT